MSPADEHDGRRRIEAIRAFLDTHASARRVLIIFTTVAGPAFLVLLTYTDFIPISKPQSFGVASALTVVIILLGALLAATEKSTGDIASELTTAHETIRTERLASLGNNDRKEAKIADLEDEADRLNALSTLRGRFFFIINLALEASHLGKPLNVRVAISLLLDEIAALAPSLLELVNGEYWSFAVYLLEEDRQMLYCCGDVRNANKDDGRGHRPWPVGRGMVGVTAFTGRLLVVDDAFTSDLQGIISDVDENRAEDDRRLYRSVAATPIFRPRDTSENATDDEARHRAIYGVVVGTSNEPERYSAQSPDRLIPLQALADAVAMVIIASNFSHTPETASTGAQTEDSDEHGRRNPTDAGHDGN